MTGAAPAVVIMARAPRRGSVHQALESVLGADGCATLASVLLVRTAAWARSVAGEAVYVAYEPADAQAELAALLGGPANFFPQSGDGIASRTAAAAGRVFASGPRPLLIVWPTLPRLRRAHAQAALDDLSHGSQVVLGPVYDGGLYLLGLREPTPPLLSLPESAWRSSEIVMSAIAAAHAAGLEIGLLRAERALHRPADARAAAADPLLPAELAAVLRRERLLD